MKSARHMKKKKRLCVIAVFTLVYIRLIVSVTIHQTKADIVRLRLTAFRIREATIPKFAEQKSLL